MALVALSFGSNLGKREKYISTALDYIRQRYLLSDIKVSSIINNKALLKPGSPQSWDMDFLNCVAVGYTDFGVHSLLQLLQEVEMSVSGRCKKTWAPREIDIDILLYDRLCVSDIKVTVPHPEMLHRDFLVKLLAEIAPDLIYPGRGRVYNCSFQEIVKGLV